MKKIRLILKSKVGLVPEKRTITRGGKTFQQTIYVQPVKKETPLMISRIKTIVSEHQAAKIQGVMVDAQTANVISQIHDALTPDRQQKFMALPIKRMARIAWHIVGMNKSRFSVGQAGRAKRNVYAEGMMDKGMDKERAYAMATAAVKEGAQPRQKKTKKKYRAEMKRQKKEKKQMEKSSQLKMGVDVEKEHKDTIQFIKDYYRKNGKFPEDKAVYAKIAGDHLEEFKDYYTELKEMEAELKQEAKKKKKVVSATVVKFLKDNPNPSDEQVHAFAKKSGYDNHVLEHVIYKLATKYVKQKGEQK